MKTSKVMFIIYLAKILSFSVGRASLFRLYYEGWNFNSGNYLFTTDTK